MEVAEATQHQTNLRAISICLFGGVLLIFLAFFSGDGGYMDVREYLDDAQRLWLKWDLRLSKVPPVYSRYALGLPFVSGPFVWAGQLLSLATGGAVHARGVTALVVPVLGAGAAAAFFFWSISQGSSARVACWAAMLLAFSTPLFTYTQHFHTEVLVLCCVLMAVWSFAQARRTGKGAWLLAAGLALGLMPMSHYSSAPTAGAFGVSMIAIVLMERGTWSERWKHVGLLAVGPMIAAMALLGTNYVRYGMFFTTGYHIYFAPTAGQFMRVEYIPQNLKVLAGWLLRTPWLAPAMAMTGSMYWRDRTAWLPIALAVAVQTFFWLCYRDLYLMTNRYLLPMTGLWALGLPLLGQRLERRFSTRGLVYSLVPFLMIGFAGFMRDDGIRAFYTDPVSGGMRCFAWYMQPQTHPTQFGTPCGPVQWLVLFALLAGGVTLIVRAWRIAGRIDGFKFQVSSFKLTTDDRKLET